MDGQSFTVGDHESQILLCTWIKRTRTSSMAMGNVPDAIEIRSTDHRRVQLRYRRGVSPRSGREAMVFVGEVSE
jgi:hypothetical protein